MSIMGDVEAVLAESVPDGASIDELLAALPDHTPKQVRDGVKNLLHTKRIERRGEVYHRCGPDATYSPTEQAVLRALRAMGPGQRTKATALSRTLHTLKGADIVEALKALILAGVVVRDDEGFVSLALQDNLPAEKPPVAPGEQRADEPVPDPVPPQARAEGAPAKGNGAAQENYMGSRDEHVDDELDDAPVMRFFDETFDTLRDAVHQALAAGGTVPHVEDLGLKLTTLERLQVLVAGDIADVLKAIADDLRGLGPAA